MQKAKDFHSPLSGLSCKSKTISQVHGLLSSCDWSLSAGLGAARSSGTLAGEKANITPWSPCLVLPQYPTVWSNPSVSIFSTPPQLNSTRLNSTRLDSTQLNSTQLNSPSFHGGSSLLHNNFSTGSWFEMIPHLEELILLHLLQGKSTGVVQTRCPHFTCWVRWEPIPGIVVMCLA